MINPKRDWKSQNSCSLTGENSTINPKRDWKNFVKWRNWIFWNTDKSQKGLKVNTTAVKIPSNYNDKSQKGLKGVTSEFTVFKASKINPKRDWKKILSLSCNSNGTSLDKSQKGLKVSERTVKHYLSDCW